MRVLIILLISVVCLTFIATTVNAQDSWDGAGPWSSGVIVFEMNEGSIHAPVLVPDPAGGLHAFWWTQESDGSDDGGKSQAIYYTRLEGNSWLSPVDIIAARGARFPDAAVTSDGVINLMWNAGSDGFLTARSTIEGELSSRAWTSAIDMVAGNLHGSIITDGRTGLHAFVPGREAEGPIYLASEDGGATWVAYAPIAATQRADTSADWIRAAVDELGTIHVAWTEFQLPKGWPPTGVYYSKSTDGGADWSEPFELAGEGYDQISVATVSSREIHVVWNGMAGVRGRYHRWSTDGGTSWSEVNVIATGGATSGTPQLVVDSAGTLHLVTIVGPCAEYSFWTAETESWSELHCISSPDARESGWIEEPTFALTEGNKLHVLHWDNRERLWYYTSQTPSPWMQPALMEIADINSSEGFSTPREIQTAELEHHHESDLNINMSGLPPSPNKASTNSILMVAILPAAVIIGTVVTIWVARRYVE